MVCTCATNSWIKACLAVRAVEKLASVTAKNIWIADPTLTAGLWGGGLWYDLAGKNWGLTKSPWIPFSR